MATRYTFPVTKEMASAKTTARVSTKHSQFVAKQINRKNFAIAKKIVDGLASEKRGIDSYSGKYYTKTSKQILRLLNLLEANALNKGLVPEEMQLLISAHQGPAYLRSRRKRMFGMKLKVTHLQAALRPSKKKVKKVEVPKKTVPKPVKKETKPNKVDAINKEKPKKEPVKKTVPKPASSDINASEASKKKKDKEVFT